MSFDPRWLTIAGLIFDLLGAFVLSVGLMISKKTAIKLGVTRWAGTTDEENLKLTAVKDRLKQSRNAIIGIILLSIGFILQIVASLIQMH